MLSKSFKPGKCKTTLKLAAARIKLLKNKRDVQVKQLKREVAQLLEAGQDQTARIRVEHVIREEKTMSAYDLIELYCELIVARLAIIESQKNCPIDLKEAISSVIFASPRCADLPELLDVQKQFKVKYGKEFITSALELRPDCGVNRMIVEKLSATAPPIETKIKVLTAIAQEHNVKWEPKAFEEKGQKPPEDLLNGPTTFASASKAAMESNHVQFPPPSSKKHESAAKPCEQDVARSSASSNSFSPGTSVPTSSWTEPQTSERRNEAGGFGQSYSREENASLNHQKWNMEFKDATSAAQAAAESAEMASIAARAAAELASLGNYARHSNGTHEPSVYSARHEGPGSPMGSNLKAESISRDSMKMDSSGMESTHKPNTTKPKIQNQERNEAGHDHMGVYERVNKGRSSSNSDRFVSSPSSMTPVDDDISETAFKSTNAFSRRSPSEQDFIYQNQQSKKIGRDELLGGESNERHLTRSASSHSSSSFDGDVSVINLQKSDGYPQKCFSKEESLNQNFEGKRTEYADAGRGRMERKPIKSGSSSSSRDGLENDTNWDSFKHENDIDEHSVVGAGHQIKLSGHTQRSFDGDSPVFDDFGLVSSDGDNCVDFGSNDKEHEGDPYLSHRGSYTFSSDRDPWSDNKQHGSGFHVKDSSNSELRLLTDLHDGEFSESTWEGTLPSKLAAATYDVSDGCSSENDDEMDNFTQREGMQSSSQHEQNISIRSSSPLQTGHELSEPDKEYGSRDVLDDQHAYRHRNSLRNLRDSGSFNSQLDKDQQSQGSRKPSVKVEAKTVDNVGPSSPHSSTTGSESRSSYESGRELNFGRLTGGLRNKGFVRPPYVRSPLGDETHPSDKLTDDSPPYTEKPTISYPDKTSENLEVESQELQKQKPYTKSDKDSRSITPLCDSDSDSSEDEELQRFHALRGRGYIRDVSGPSGRTTDDTATLDEKQQRSFVRASKESSPAKMTAYFDTNTNKQAPHGIRSRHPRSDGGSVSFNKEPDDTLSTGKPTVSKPYKISGSSEPHETKKQVKAQMESRSRTAIPYFDEENDEEEVMQPRYTVGNVGNRGGRLSQRTRDLLSKNKDGQIPKSTGQSDVSGTSDLGSPFRLNYLPDSPFNSTNQTVSLEKKEISKFLPPKSSVEQHSLPPPETQGSAQKESRKSSHKDSSETVIPASNENTEPSTSTEVSASREGSFKRSSHVHPNLPDYESLAAHFKSLRGNKR